MGMYIALIIFNIAAAYYIQDDAIFVFLAGFNTGTLTLLAIMKKLDNQESQ